ncbi:hypothetical protein OG521_37100 [Streptomyces sp. NBC_01463]
MGGPPGTRRFRAGVTGALVCAVALTLAGCGVVSTKEDRRFAEKLAEAHYPGVLRVIGARTLFPKSGGSEITFAVADDPDAVVRMRVDAEAGTCNTHACKGVLDDAVERGRSEAAGLRVLIRTFRSCGYEVVGVEPSSGAPWIVASLTNATVTRVLADIGSCVRKWKEPDTRGDRPAGRPGASVNLASPSVAGNRPAGNKSQPTAMRLSETRLLAALQSRPYYAASYTAADGRLDTAGRARIVRPFATQQRFARTAQQAVRTQLLATHPRVQVSEFSGVWSLEPGTVDRLTGYVLYCEEPDRDKRCLGDKAVVVTTDVRGNPVGQPRPVGTVRQGRGPLRLPPL